MPTKKQKGANPNPKSEKRKRVSPGKSGISKSMPVLPRSQERLRTVLNMARMGLWEWEIQTGKVTWTGGIPEIYRLPQGSFAQSFEIYIKTVHPDDRQKLRQHLEETLASDKPYFSSHRIFSNDGSIRWLESYGAIFRNKKGKPIRMSGVVQDVTERKSIEQEREDWKTRHELVVSSAGLVIYDYDIPSGGIIWSGNCLEVLGYRPEELGNIDRWVQLIHQNDREEAFRLLQHAQEALKPYDVYYRFLAKNGSYCYLHDRGTFIADAAGKAYRMLGMMNDVTPRIKAQQLLQESELRFRTLQQASFGGICLNDQGRIIDCNQSLCDITGYSTEELMGSDGLNLIAPEWRELAREKISGGYEKIYDVEGIKKDGSRYFLQIQGKNIPYNGKMIRVTEFRDISERKRAEEKILEQNTRLIALTEELKRKNNQLEEFTQIVSHNLRAPVGNIFTLLSFHEGAESEREKAEYFKLLKESAATTLAMLDELNDILKIKQNKNIEKQHLRFNHVFHQVKSMLNARIAAISAQVTTDFSRAETIHYPVIYLESILLNLLDNALKYHSPQRTPHIKFTTHTSDKGEIILEVSDNGLGINLERYGHHVFKLRKTFHFHPESRGVGLFMIKNQIETMGGEITISSREHEGTTFFINFNKYHADGL